MDKYQIRDLLDNHVGGNCAFFNRNSTFTEEVKNHFKLSDTDVETHAEKYFKVMRLNFLEQKEAFFNDKEAFIQELVKETSIDLQECTIFAENFFVFFKDKFHQVQTNSPIIQLFYDQRLSDIVVRIFIGIVGLFEEIFILPNKTAISYSINILTKPLCFKIPELTADILHHLTKSFCRFGVKISAITTIENCFELKLQDDFIEFVETFKSKIQRISFIGFRGYKEVTKIECNNINLFIGKNNTGKTNLVELIRFCSANSAYELINDIAGSWSGEEYEHYLFTRSSNKYFPYSIRLVFDFAGDNYFFELTGDSPNAYILKYFKNNSLFCTVLFKGPRRQVRVIWGNEPVDRIDWRTVRLKYDDARIKNEFEKISSEFFGNKKVAIHFGNHDSRSQIDKVEVALYSYEKKVLDNFLDEINTYFGIPKLIFFMVIEVPGPGFVLSNKARNSIKMRLDEITELENLLKKFSRNYEMERIREEVKNIKETLKPTKGNTAIGGSLSVDGALFLKARAFGSGFRSLLSLLLKIKENDIILIDEPETFLHHTLQVKLAEYIIKKAKTKQFFIASHSEVFLNLFFENRICSIYQCDINDNNSSIHIIDKDNINSLIKTLGARASFILQSNCIIWVEGPSDSIYFNKWIDLISQGMLKEGVHYQCVFYGGKLLSNVTFEKKHGSEPVIQLLTVNRNAIILLDSDKRNEKENINSTKNRIILEIQNSGGFGWTTAGREIENYISQRILASMYPKLNRNLGKYEKISDYIGTVDKSFPNWFQKNKKEFAIQVTKHFNLNDLFHSYDLMDKLILIKSMIMRWNGMDESQFS